MAAYRTTAARTVNETGANVREVRRSTWSPAQVVAILGGLLLLVLGAVGLARTGLSFSNIAFTHTQVAGLPVTSLSALAELIVGVILLIGAAFPSSAKATMAILGVVMLAFGLIVALDPRPFFRLWAYDSGSGIFFVIVGAVLLVAAAVSPVILSRRNVVVRESNNLNNLQDPNTVI